MADMDAVLHALERAVESGLIPLRSSVLLAVSGGADSMGLLYGAVEATRQTGWRLSVGHVHHGWRGREADRDLSFVAEHARRLGLAFSPKRRDARTESRTLGLSPEAGARHVRYEALREIAQEMGALLIATAHQREDAIESHLLARERQGGLAALAGPRERREDGVVRPLLRVTREEILRFLAERGVAFRRDATNGNLRLSRNRIRRRLAALREAEGGEAAMKAIAEEIARLGSERRRLERDYETSVLPGVRFLPDGVVADAALLARSPEELQRLALMRLAAPFARPGRPPMTGRERERLRELLDSGEDFRFEAGRRVRFERRGPALTIRPRDPVPVYDSPSRIPERHESPEVAR